MPPLTVCSFYVERRADYPDAADYLPLLRVLDRSCRLAGFRHVVLTDFETAPEIDGVGLATFAMDLSRNLMRALTESQARCIESLIGSDILFTGADCLVRRDFRNQLPVADLSIILRPGHRKHRINNGFMFVPAASRNRVAPLFRRIADGCGETMCDDMVAVEHALAPMPDDYCLTERGGLTVNFLPMGIWNGGPKSADDPADQSHVLHFRGRARKAVMLDWAARWLPEDAAC
jgi:hypothetical protein